MHFNTIRIAGRIPDYFREALRKNANFAGERTSWIGCTLSHWDICLINKGEKIHELTEKSSEFASQTSKFTTHPSGLLPAALAQSTASRKAEEEDHFFPGSSGRKM